MLHIVTPLYRFENLEKLYNSIFMDEDITWHISKSNKREDIDFDFIKNDKRIILYDLDINDDEIGKKRGEALKNIKDGYFCLLDDDTIFHENMYFKYRECLENKFKGMIVGEQINWDGKVRLIASPPKKGRIDTGNVLSHSSCLETCEWPTIPWTCNDYLFWESVYEYYGKKCGIWNQPISYYNRISKKRIKYLK